MKTNMFLSIFLLLLASKVQADITNAVQVTQKGVQHLNCSPETILSLHTPAGEAEWASDFRPTIIHRGDNNAWKGTVFTTDLPGHPPDVWVMSDYNEGDPQVHYVRFSSGQYTTEIEIHFRKEGRHKTKSTLVFRRTGLSQEGNEYILKNFTQEAFDDEMAEWQSVLNEFIKQTNPRGC